MPKRKWQSRCWFHWFHHHSASQKKKKVWHWETHLQDPLVLPKLWVKGAFLKRAQFEGKARSQLLNTNFLLILENVPWEIRVCIYIQTIFKINGGETLQRDKGYNTTQARIQLKYPPVKSEKDKVSLVVEGGDLSTHKLRVLWKEGSKHAADAVTQTRGEVVEDNLWRV